MQDHQPFCRIAVIGSSGAGKSTLARSIGERTGLPVVHLDKEHWQPGWTEPDRDSWRARLAEIAAQPRWIIDGQYGASLTERLKRADLTIFLDLPTSVCLWRVVKRFVLLRGRVRTDIGEGCPEKLDVEFIRFVASFRKLQRPAIIAAINSSGSPTTWLRSRRDQAVFVATLRGNGLAGAIGRASVFSLTDVA